MTANIPVEQDTVSFYPSVLNGIEEETNIETEAVPSTPAGSFGKFKTGDELLKAYESLEKEFTKKSQRLSQMEKQNADKETALPKLPSKEEVSPALMEEIAADANSTHAESAPPLFERENWQQTVADFLQKNQEAKPYAASISAEILADAGLRQNPNALELAWGRVARKTFKNPIELAKDQHFLDLVLSEDAIKQKVMEIYLNELDGRKLPGVMGSGLGLPAFAAKTKPQSLSDAKKYLEKILTQ